MGQGIALVGGRAILLSPAKSARAVALDAISRVVEDGGYSSLAIPAALARSGLDQRDRAFASELAYGTCRRLISLDWALNRIAARPVTRMTPGVRAIARMGAYQILFTEVAPHAAVGETVGLAAERERGFVNAVLRRLAAEPPAWPVGDSEEDVSIRTGVAPWVVRELRHLVDVEAEAAAAALATRGRLTIRANTCQTTTEQLESSVRLSGKELVRSKLDPDCLILDGGDPARLPGYSDGLFAVQDQASSLVVRALDPQPGQRVLDVCAAPGGKASFSSCLVGSGGLVVAADVHHQRVGLMRRGAERLRTPLALLVQDARSPAVRPVFDRVLVDAPCSGLGAARRRPELLWRPKAADLSPLASLQVAISVAAAAALVPGGRLVYSVCTFTRSETDAVADAILRKCPDLEPAKVPGPFGPAERFRTWPHLHGCDGMFVAGFGRRA
jgi:16S rRNA (cytosine967-C5)-methyltransferase